MILPLPDTQLQVDAPTLFPRGGTPWGLFGAEPFAGQGLPQRVCRHPQRRQIQRTAPETMHFSIRPFLAIAALLRRVKLLLF